MVSMDSSEGRHPVGSPIHTLYDRSKAAAYPLIDSQILDVWKMFTPPAIPEKIQEGLVVEVVCSISDGLRRLVTILPAGVDVYQ